MFIWSSLNGRLQIIFKFSNWFIRELFTHHHFCKADDFIVEQVSFHPHPALFPSGHLLEPGFRDGFMFIHIKGLAFVHLF